MRYPVLVLDHDDTVMDSTRCIHHPAFQDALDQMRPGMTMDLETYFKINFDPGFLPYCENILHFSSDELKREYEIWQSWVKKIIPSVFPGMDTIIKRQIQEGGRVCVISHSVADNIRRDYAANNLPMPALVYGWEQPRERRKPDPWPLQEIMRLYKAAPSDLLMVDDLKPGFQTAGSAGVDFAAALWAHQVPDIHQEMHRISKNCFETPRELEHWLFD